MIRINQSILNFFLVIAAWYGAADLLKAACQKQESQLLYFSFDEGQGKHVTDKVSGSVKKIAGQAAWEDGVSGKSLRLNGIDTYIHDGAPLALDIGKGFTVEAWIRTEVLGRQFIVQQYDGNGWSMEICDGKIIARLTRDGKGLTVDGGDFYADGRWHQVTLIWDGRILSMYVDSRLTDSAEMDKPTRFFANADLLVGKYGTGERFYGFCGLVDEMRIFNRALTAAEVRGNYSRIMPQPAEVPSLQNDKQTLVALMKDMRSAVLVLDGKTGDTITNRLNDLERRLQAINVSTWEAGEEKARLKKIMTDVAELRNMLAGLRTAAIAGHKSKPVVWVSNPLVNIFQDAILPEVIPENEVRIEACRGEYEPAQIAISSYDYRGPVQVKVGPLLHTGGEGSISTVTARYVGYVPATGNIQDTYLIDRFLRQSPGKFPDPLLAVEQVELAPRQTQPVWITVKVPGTAAAGTYRGNVEIETEAGKNSVPITLTVWPLELPEKPTLWLGAWGGIDCLADKPFPADNYDENYFESLKTALQNRREHRCWTYSDRPLWSIYHTVKVYWRNGNYEYDYTIFDEFLSVIGEAYDGHFRVIDVGGFSGSVDVLNANGLVSRSKSFQNPSFSNPSFQNYLAAFLQSLQEHLKQKGWLEKVYFKVQDEPDAAALPQVRQISSFVKRVAPELRQNETIEPDAVSLLKEVDLSIVGWNGLSNAPRGILTPELQKGREIWTYNNYTSMVDMPLIHTRINGFVNYLYGLSGYSHWAWAISWPECNGHSPWEDAYYPPFGPGEGFLIYLDHNPKRILDSIRWEMFREAAEDYDTLALFAAAGGDAQAVCNKLVRGMRGDYEKNYQKFYQVRHDLLHELNIRRTARNPAD